MSVLFPEEAKAAIECLLFVAVKPLSIAELTELVGLPADDVQELLVQLGQEYNRNKHGFHLTRVGNGYRLCTRPEYYPYVEKLNKSGPTGLSAAALETLAIIAYKQPITRGEIELIRGVKVDRLLTNLMERGLIKEVGRKEVPGRPILYGTTEQFLWHFGLRDLAELPELEE
ncbi:MAG: SMC-Scp complex subunit ScpB [Firmicutes bacterium]|nr:SMC-Scp complex subunit ScpB [Bacillota bacterium]